MNNKVEKKIDKKINDLTLKMQFFCLDPNQQIYQEIVSSTKLKNVQSDVFEIWNLAVCTKYGEELGLGAEEIKKYTEKFNRESKQISTLLLLRPTSRILDKMWYIFFATGELASLQAAFETAGNAKASKELKETSVKTFETVRDEYQQKIHLAKSNKTPLTDYFHNVCETFDKFEEILKKKTKEIEKLDSNPLESNISEILSKVSEQRIASGEVEESDSSNSESEEETDPKKRKEKEKKKAIKKEVKEAGNLFDEIAKDVMNKVSLTPRK